MEFYAKDENATIQIAKDFAKTLKEGDVVALYGDLGAGKTTFTRGIAEFFDVEYCHSPTFNLVNEYLGTKKLYHFDAYRINEDDWYGAGFDEYLFDDGICIIEWPSNIENVLPENTIRINITYYEDGRKIEIN